ncbi:hypothetical protein LWI29_032154 [Acer saccharum]|uniref:Uncharacterized protein n=1 Tax=Acer saccharum TaxID=4024 RepID=A0AA39RVY0_ACESA|nr:hypothetical protein LWI29_032154 [Acer saccharum]
MANGVWLVTEMVYGLVLVLGYSFAHSSKKFSYQFFQHRSFSEANEGVLRRDVRDNGEELPVSLGGVSREGVMGEDFNALSDSSGLPKQGPVPEDLMVSEDNGVPSDGSESQLAIGVSQQHVVEIDALMGKETDREVFNAEEVVVEPCVQNIFGESDETEGPTYSVVEAKVGSDPKVHEVDAGFPPITLGLIVSTGPEVNTTVDGPVIITNSSNIQVEGVLDLAHGPGPIPSRVGEKLSKGRRHKLHSRRNWGSAKKKLEVQLGKRKLGVVGGESLLGATKAKVLGSNPIEGVVESVCVNSVEVTSVVGFSTEVKANEASVSAGRSSTARRSQ